MTSRVDSPCIRRCCLDEQDICVGCYRTLDEIIAWGNLDDPGRWAVLEHARQRREWDKDRRQW